MSMILACFAVLIAACGWAGAAYCVPVEFFGW
jgi:hypothetical protein